MISVHHPAGASMLDGASRKSIIVIDDEEAVRAVLVKMILRLGYSVYEADAGPVGLAAIDQVEGSLVALLVDMTMPDMNGAEVARAALGRCAGLQVILMSGHPGEALVRDYGLEGQVGILQKPFNLSMIYKLLG